MHRHTWIQRIHVCWARGLSALKPRSGVGISGTAYSWSKFHIQKPARYFTQRNKTATKDRPQLASPGP